jgi:ethanolamine utilization protein EutN
MLKAKVVGRVWSSKRLADVPGGPVPEVRIEDDGARLLAFDPLGCGAGETVMIATGSVAAAWFKGKPPPIDALIIGSIDETDET